MTLSTIFAFIVSATYFVTGALDLGVGLLLPLIARRRDRAAALIESGQPWSAAFIWTSLTFAFAIAGLPTSIAAMEALWLPLLGMLMALALRGGISTVRRYALRQDLCDLFFGLASLVAVVCQGLVLGWLLIGFGENMPARHAEPLGLVSVWGLLCAIGLVGTYGLIGAGWLIWSGRGAVRTFGREVGHSATLVVGGALTLAIMSLLARVVDHVIAPTWMNGGAAGVLVAAAFALLAPTWLTLWSRHTTVPFACAVASFLCNLASLALLPWPATVSDAAGDGSYPAYLVFVLLTGSPVVIADIIRRRAVLIGNAGPMPTEASSHAGRRSNSLVTSLHLS